MVPGVLLISSPGTDVSGSVEFLGDVQRPETMDSDTESQLFQCYRGLMDKGPDAYQFE